MNVLTEIHGRRGEDSYKILDDSSSIADVDVLQRSETRRKTDRIFLFVFLACIGILMPFLIYTLCNSDINRLKGYDTCGNICGQKNIKDRRWSCSGLDMTHKPILHYSKECKEIDNSNFIPPVQRLNAETLFFFTHRAEWKLFLLTLLPLSLCFILVVLFRYVPAVAIWGSLILFSVILTAAGCLFLVYIAVVWSVIPLVIFFCISISLLVIWIIFNVNKIRLTTIILKEATRAVFEVKMTSGVALAALCLLTVILVIFSTIVFHISTAGILKPMEQGHLAYVKNEAMIIAIVLNSVLVIWGIQFVCGAQYMTVSGAVARWYTSKNQDGIHDSVIKSGRATLKYHLGTIALGSVLITIMAIPRGILQFSSKFSGFKQKADAWLKCFDGYFSTNTYIITAMYATSFIPSGRKAAQILKLSIGNTMDLNNFTNFVIITCQSLVVFVSTLGTYITLYYVQGVYGLYSDFFSLIAFAFANFCAQTILGTLQVSANTLFLCASEELLKNKDADFPYTMTLAEFTEGANRLLLQKVQNRPPSNIIEKSFYIKLFLFIFVAVGCVMYFVAFFI